MGKLSIRRVPSRTLAKLSLTFLIGIYFLGITFARIEINLLGSDVTIDTNNENVIKGSMLGYYSFGALITTDSIENSIMLVPVGSIKTINKKTKFFDETLGTKISNWFTDIGLAVKNLLGIN